MSPDNAAADLDSPPETEVDLLQKTEDRPVRFVLPMTYAKDNLFYTFRDGQYYHRFSKDGEVL